MAGPLQGIKVVEFGQMIAVPAATHLLATQGADVIKVENAAGGDDLRAYGSQKGGMSGWFANANAGKRSIGLDLATDAGKAVLWQLIEGADVFAQGFRPGAIDRLGFGADAALDRHPALIYVSSAGFGLDGPYAERPVYDPVIQALAGWAGAQTTSEGPSLVSGMVADKVAAYTSAQAITAALFERSRTGLGQHIEISMLEANIAFNWPDVMMHCTLLDDDALHLPNLLAYYQLFECSDGFVSVTAGNDSQWLACCGALDRDDLAADERFATAAARGSNFAEWYEHFAAMIRPFSTQDVLTRMADADVPAVPVLDPADVVDDPQVQARDAVRVVDHPVAGRMRQPAPGARFASGEPALSPAPMHGEQSAEILAELGYGQDNVEALRAAGAVV